MDLSGKYVLLTGGSRGLGPVIAAALARRGAHLALTARSEEALRGTVEELARMGSRALALPADLAYPPDRERLVERALGEMGRVDVLVNNAGLEPDGAFAQLPWEEMAQMIEVNVAAPVHLARLLLPGMLARGSGSVVNVSSLAGRVGLPYDSVYSGTKAAINQWSEGLRRELRGSGVKVSTVLPGYVNGTGMFARKGMRAPALTGSTTPERVAEGVVRAVESGAPEVVVNSLPMRPVFALAGLFPSLADWAVGRMGIVDFQRRKATR